MNAIDRIKELKEQSKDLTIECQFPRSILNGWKEALEAAQELICKYGIGPMGADKPINPAILLEKILEWQKEIDK